MPSMFARARSRQASAVDEDLAEYFAANAANEATEDIESAAIAAAIAANEASAATETARRCRPATTGNAATGPPPNYAAAMAASPQKPGARLGADAPANYARVRGVVLGAIVASLFVDHEDPAAVARFKCKVIALIVVAVTVTIAANAIDTIGALVAQNAHNHAIVDGVAQNAHNHAIVDGVAQNAHNHAIDDGVAQYAHDHAAVRRLGCRSIDLIAVAVAAVIAIIAAYTLDAIDALVAQNEHALNPATVQRLKRRLIAAATAAIITNTIVAAAVHVALME